jgi:hypothetical protein
MDASSCAAYLLGVKVACHSGSFVCGVTCLFAWGPSSFFISFEFTAACRLRNVCHLIIYTTNSSNSCKQHQ